MSNQTAHQLHDGFTSGGLALGAALVAGQRTRTDARRVAVAQAASDANAVSAVRRLAGELQASRARETALQAELAAMRADLVRAQAALIRLAR